MAGRQAKILTDFQVEKCLQWVGARRRYPHRDKVVVLLSVKAGLRAMEIAKLRRWHVMTSDGLVDDVIHLENRICKKGSGRTIPMAPILREHILDLFKKVPGAHYWPLILSERAMNERNVPTDQPADEPYCMEPKSVCNFFWQMFKELGFIGCSSHSGRRTFITRGARLIVQAGGSLRDVQQLAGHKRLDTTQGYIEGDNEAKRKLVQLI